MKNIQTGDKYTKQLYYFLRDEYDGNNCPIPKNKKRSAIALKCYEREMKKLGLNPKTEEVLKAVNHDNTAVTLRFKGINSISTLFYKEFKAVTHIINNKYNYMGKKVDLKEIKEIKSTSEGTVCGIGKNSIVLNIEGQKHFFWYLGVPLKYCGNNTSSKGTEIAKYLINTYGE